MRTPRIFHWLRTHALLALRIWLIAGIWLRVTRWRDRWEPLAVVYYTTPWPVIAAGFVVIALHFAHLRDWHRFRRYLVFAVVAHFTWSALSWFSAPQNREAPEVRVVLWNVARPEGRLDGIARWLRTQDADVIALAEAEKATNSAIDRWRAAFPEYDVQGLPEGMLRLVRGEVLSRETGTLWRGSGYGLLRVRVRGRDLTVLQADIYGQPLHSRRRPLARLAEIARAHAGENLIVLGDMNTPRDSVHFDAFRTMLTECFAAAGRGFAETWPMPLPVLSLDHAWMGGELRAVSCRHPWTWRSDHRPAVIELAGFGAE